jgi:hypothetical protein
MIPPTDLIEIVKSVIHLSNASYGNEIDVMAMTDHVRASGRLHALIESFGDACACRWRMPYRGCRLRDCSCMASDPASSTEPEPDRSPVPSRSSHSVGAVYGAVRTSAETHTVNWRQVAGDEGPAFAAVL